MRVRTAKQRAQRIDLNYFKHAHGMRRWRTLLSAALPVAALLWIGGAAAAGSRRVYSAGPVASAHAFAEQKCEVCHSAATRAGLAADRADHGDQRLRRHTTEAACLTCHERILGPSRRDIRSSRPSGPAPWIRAACVSIMPCT